MESQSQENQENQLAVIVKDSGLDKTKSQILLDQFSNYFEIAATWENKAKTLIVTDVSQKTEMKMAREGRLFLKAKRVDIEKARKELKEQSLREGQTIDAIAKILKNLIEPIEQHLEKQEKFAEIKEKEMKEERKITREATLTALNFDYTYTDLLNMPDIQFDELVLKIENEISAKIEADRLAEEQRIEAEQKAESERIEKERLQKEENEKIRLENERLQKEAKERENQLAKEREERERIERDIAAKKQEDARIAKANELAKKKAAAAPDKDKLTALVKLIEDIEMPIMATDEANSILESVDQLLGKVCTFIEQKRDQL